MFSDVILSDKQQRLVQKWTVPSAHFGSADQIVAHTDSVFLFVYFEHSLNVG